MTLVRTVGHYGDKTFAEYIARITPVGRCENLRVERYAHGWAVRIYLPWRIDDTGMSTHGVTRQ